MNPKEKAEELYQKYFEISPEWLFEGEAIELSKLSSLIAVDELINETQFEVPNIRQKYWQEVKQEIENL